MKNKASVFIGTVVAIVLAIVSYLLLFKDKAQPTMNVSSTLEAQQQESRLLNGSVDEATNEINNTVSTFSENNSMALASSETDSPQATVTTHVNTDATNTSTVTLLTPQPLSREVIESRSVHGTGLPADKQDPVKLAQRKDVYLLITAINNDLSAGKKPQTDEVEAIGEELVALTQEGYIPIDDAHETFDFMYKTMPEMSAVLDKYTSQLPQ